MLTGNPKSK